jgi:uncharacterized protein (DUF433 family)
MWDATKPRIESRPYSGGTITIVQSIRWIPLLPETQEVKWRPPRIVRTPGVLGGKPRITDHRISVQDVAIWHYHLGLSVDDIATKYDLSPDDVQAALTYHADHRDEIEEAIRAGEAFVSEMRQRYPSKLKAQRDG